MTKQDGRKSSKPGQDNDDDARSSTGSRSRTQAALDWLDAHPGETAYAAAKAFGLASTTLYKAIKQREATKDQRCPTCGQLIRGESHDQADITEH